MAKLGDHRLPNKKKRKIGVPILLESDEIKFLDKKIDKRYKERQSRSALIRMLIRKAMEDPALLDID